MEQSRDPKDYKCLMCENAQPTSVYWVFQWKGKSGYACEKCSTEWYAIGNYLVEKAAEMMKQQAVDVSCVKDKFGEWRIYYTTVTEEQERFVRALENKYQTLYPEFSWSFD